MAASIGSSGLPEDPACRKIVSFAMRGILRPGSSLDQAGREYQISTIGSADRRGDDASAGGAAATAARVGSVSVNVITEVGHVQDTLTYAAGGLGILLEEKAEEQGPIGRKIQSGDVIGATRKALGQHADLLEEEDLVGLRGVGIARLLSDDSELMDSFVDRLHKVALFVLKNEKVRAVEKGLSREVTIDEDIPPDAIQAILVSERMEPVLKAERELIGESTYEKIQFVESTYATLEAQYQELQGGCTQFQLKGMKIPDFAHSLTQIVKIAEARDDFQGVLTHFTLLDPGPLFASNPNSDEDLA